MGRRDFQPANFMKDFASPPQQANATCPVENRRAGQVARGTSDGRCPQPRSRVVRSAPPPQRPNVTILSTTFWSFGTTVSIPSFLTPDPRYFPGSRLHLCTLLDSRHYSIRALDRRAVRVARDWISEAGTHDRIDPRASHEWCVTSHARDTFSEDKHDYIERLTDLNFS